LTAAANSTTPTLVENWDGEPILFEAKETITVLTKEIAAVEKVHAERQREVMALVEGTSGPELIAKYEAAKADYMEAKAEFAKLQTRITDTENDIDDREAKWGEQLMVCANRVKNEFNNYMNMKQFSGTCKFDHGSQELHLVTQMDKDKTSRCNDVRQMSGGERSYTTLCLLMSLGHVMETPFRLMDEYDVFLDEMSRKITLTSICTYALLPLNLNKQFFVITPHELKHVKPTNQVRVKVMPDPVRITAAGLQQQTL
jgi:chromosome segregation ATPase